MVLFYSNRSQVARKRHNFQHRGLPRLRAAHQVGAPSAAQPFGPALVGFPHAHPSARHEASPSDQARTFLRRIGRHASATGDGISRHVVCIYAFGLVWWCGWYLWFGLVWWC